jgi:hypothetical protein
MEYILQNVPNYAEASVQLEQKSPKWKQNWIKKTEIDKIKRLLKQKGLIDKGLIEERDGNQVSWKRNVRFSTRQVWTKWGFDDTNQIGKSQYKIKYLQLLQDIAETKDMILYSINHPI